MPFGFLICHSAPFLVILNEVKNLSFPSLRGLLNPRQSKQNHTLVILSAAKIAPIIYSFFSTTAIGRQGSLRPPGLSFPPELQSIKKRKEFSFRPELRAFGLFPRWIVHRSEKFIQRHVVESAYDCKGRQIRKVFAGFQIRNVQACAFFQLFLRMIMNATELFHP